MKSKTLITKKSITGLVFFLLSIIGIVFGCQYFLHDCLWWDCAPERDFHVLELELPSSLFPEEFQITPFDRSSEGNGEIERASQSVFWDNGNRLAGYDVNRYSSIKEAIHVFDSDYKQMLDSETKNAWIRPKELTYTSSTADQFQVSCGDWSGRRCGMLARYQEYEIFFSATMDDKMTYADFEKIVVYIDKQISSHLYP